MRIIIMVIQKYTNKDNNKNNADNIKYIHKDN